MACRFTDRLWVPGYEGFIIYITTAAASGFLTSENPLKANFGESPFHALR